MNGHTAGPWLVDSVGSVDASIYGLTNRYRNPVWVARVYGDGGAIAFDHASPERMANARLIAAAPEMLEALALALRGLGVFYDAEQDCPKDPIMRDIGNAMRLAEAALAKARGKGGSP